MFVVVTGSKLENSGCVGPPVKARADSGASIWPSSAAMTPVAIGRRRVERWKFIITRMLIIGESWSGDDCFCGENEVADACLEEWVDISQVERMHFVVPA